MSGQEDFDYSLNKKVCVRGGIMTIKLKIFTLFALVALLLTMWLPNLVVNEKVYAKDEGAGSTIAGIPVANLNNEEIMQVLEEKIASFKKSPIIVRGAGVEKEIDISLFTFDVQSTVNAYEEKTSKPWYAFWKDTPVVHIPLQVTADNRVKALIEEMTIWNIDETYNQTLSDVGNLKSEIDAKVKDLTALEEERLALSIEKIPADAVGVNELASMLNDFVVAPNQNISLLKAFGSFADTTNQAALDFVASLVYHTVLQTNYKIVERYSQNKVPAYLEAGIEATVNKELNRDFRFINESKNASKYTATVEDGSLKLELKTQVADVTAVPRVETDKFVNPKLITRYSPKLAYYQQQVLQVGKEGKRVLVYRVISENGSTKDELISRDYYPAVNRIILKSSRAPLSPTTPTDSGTTPDPNTDLSVDLNGDGLPDNTDTQTTVDPTDAGYPAPGQTLPDGSYYDKGGNLVTP